MDTQDLEIKSIANNWSSWMTGQTNFKRLDNNKIQVITPFVDNFGDGILFNIISKENDIYQVTDEGYTIWNLTSNGINVKSKQSNRWRILLSIITPYNFKIGKNDTIFKLVKKSELSQTITDFIQVLINVSDIAFMNRTNTASFFLMMIEIILMKEDLIIVF
ncbi:DUF1828 domain-containing protein [Latilactobacillus sakei]|uniref:DUF1828 domain-containing protein n=1 Tax=Latilactobacillus sakei TaxID=1599 RepID=UPI003F5352BF